jgi:hypothetical protein
MTPKNADTAPLKTVTHRLFAALTDAELFIGLSLLTTVIFGIDRWVGVIG